MDGNVAPGTERLRVNQVISEKTVQTVVRGIVTVPDPKPDVEKVLSVDKSVRVRSVQILPDKVIVEGTLILQIVYVAFKPAQSVHHMHGSINFTTFVDVPGALPGMDVNVDVTVEDVKVTRRTGRPEEFDVAAVLEVTAKVTEVMDIDAVLQCPPGCICETQQITVDNVVGAGRRQVVISEEFDVPDEKPAVEKILDTDVKVEVTETTVLKNKVIFDGIATVTVIYVGMLPDQPVHSLHRTFRFSDFVEVPGAMEGMGVKFDLRVEDAHVDVVKTPECIRLLVDIILKVTASVVEPRQVEIIEEIRDCPNVMPTFSLLKIDSLVGQEQAQVILRDVFEPPGPKPDVEKILETKVDKVTVSEKRIIAEKVIVSGFVDIQVVYVALEPDQSVHAVHRRLPFRTFVEVMGARTGDEVEVRANVEFITATVGKDGRVTVELILKVTARVTRTVQKNVLTAVTPVVVPPPVPCPPGETFEYIVQPGETLFTIGRKFGVSLNQMKAANPQLPDPDRIRPGMVVNVPCVPKG